MYEIIRLADIHPIGVLHSPSADADVAAGSYDVPAGSFVFPNFHHALRDPELWSHPNELRPEENWLNSSSSNNLGNSNKPKEFQGASRPGFVSFGMGRRKCPGQDMALTMLFAFVSNLIQVDNCFNYLFKICLCTELCSNFKKYQMI